MSENVKIAWFLQMIRCTQYTCLDISFLTDPPPSIVIKQKGEA